MQYKSCHLLEHGISFHINDTIRPCCYIKPEDNSLSGPILFQGDLPHQKIDWNKIFRKKEEYINSFKKNIIPFECENCIFIQERDWDDDKDYINYIHITHFTKCNSNCIYCYTSCDKAKYNSYKSYNIYPVIKDIVEQNLFKSTGLVEFAGGECTILEEFSDVMNILLPTGCNFKINSSGIKYSPEIQKGLENGQLNLIFSLDSANRETYLKIKQVNSFDAAINNLEEYSKYQNPKTRSWGDCYGNVFAKFIIIPNVNDTKEEIDILFQTCEKINCRNIIFDLEWDWYNKTQPNIPQKYYDLLQYTTEKNQEFQLNISYYRNAEDVLKK